MEMDLVLKFHMITVLICSVIRGLGELLYQIFITTLL